MGMAFVRGCTHEGDNGSDSGKVGVLLMNLGTPDAPTPSAVRRYLAEFLHDYRIIETTRWLWCPLLHGIILRTRPSKVAKIYKGVWGDKGAALEGSPLLAIANQQQAGLQAMLNDSADASHFAVAVCMRYGNPNIDDALAELVRAGCQKVLAIPLYPQYSCATVASSLDALFKTLQRWRFMPEVRTVTSYATHPLYIAALRASITEKIAEINEPVDKWVLSYHGTPVSFRNEGDPYEAECTATTQALAAAMGWHETDYIMTFQSQFGPAEWLGPKTDQTLERLAKEGARRVGVICPGFSADCIETLEEIEEENMEIFMEHGGEHFHYVAALNARPDHIAMLADIVGHHTHGWGGAANATHATNAANGTTATTPTKEPHHV